MRYQIGDKVTLDIGYPHCVAFNDLATKERDKPRKADYAVITACELETNGNAYYHYKTYKADGTHVDSCLGCLTDDNSDFYNPGNGEQTMTPTNVAQDLKDLDLSEDDRLIRQAGITDLSGTVTETGKSILWRYLLDSVKDGLIVDLKAIEKARKTTK